jgi:predicted  nucleic acid-binding Zn-ribbon protein
MNTDNQPDKKYQIELTALQKAGCSLEQEMHNLHHELRRVGDGIEREGGVRHVLEQQARRLKDNISLCEDDLKQNRKHQARVSKKLSDTRDTKNNGE